MKCFGRYREKALGCNFCNSITKAMCYSKTKQIKETMETKEVKIEIPEGYEIDESKSSFEKIVFKKKEKKLPKTYNDFLNNYEYSDRVGIPVPTKYEDSFRAFRMLIELRDVYNDGWKPDWGNREYKYVVYSMKGKIVCYESVDHQHVLAFKTNFLRDKFLENFKDLIEQAKELI